MSVVTTKDSSKLAFVDALRGYAVLLVIICHGTLFYDTMVSPVRRVASLGWHGVQLFFVASSLTLLLSWAIRREHEPGRVRKFFIRRWFRITPMYFIAFLVYLYLTPPRLSFSWTQLLSTFGFVNGWTPLQTPTVPGAWSSVPGNWSISDEFGFYFLFPLLATFIITIRRSVMFLLVSLALATGLNSVALPYWSSVYNPVVASQFIYYWLPNQLPVFAIGFLVFNVLHRFGVDDQLRPFREFISRHATPIVFLAWMMFISLAYIPAIRYPTIWAPYPPIHILAAMAFAVLTIAMALGGRTIFNNAPIQALGRVSFSAYLIHFGIIHVLHDTFPGFFGFGRTGLMVVASATLFLLFTLTITYSLSWLTFRVVEQPMIAFGKKVCARLDTAQLQLPARKSPQVPVTG